jgi:hypothetical protein
MMMTWSICRQVAINKWSKKKAETSYRKVAGQFHRQKVKEYNCHLAKMFLPMYIQVGRMWLVLVSMTIFCPDTCLDLHFCGYQKHGHHEAQHGQGHE